MKVDNVQRTVPGPIGSSIQFLPEVASTNDYLIAGSFPDGFVLVADLQTAGRGRGEHRWEANAGENLLFSVVLSFSLPNATLTLLPALTSLAVCEGIDALDIRGIETKWPNDIVAGERKVGGILIESRVAGSRVRVISGIGVNVNQRAFPPPLAQSATSLLLISGAPVKRTLLLGSILDELNRRIFERDHTESIRRYRDRCRTIGQAVAFETAGGQRVGRAVDIDDAGCLLIEEQGTVRSYTGSEVLHVRGSR